MGAREQFAGSNMSLFPCPIGIKRNLDTVQLWTLNDGFGYPTFLVGIDTN